MRAIKRDIVGGLLESADGKILLAKSRAGGVYTDCYLIPGGGIDDGETPEQALIREVLEETGLDIAHQTIKLIGNSQTGTSEKILKDTGEKVLVNMHFSDFHVFLDQPAENIVIQENDDIEHCQWFNKTQLKNLKLSPPTENLLRQLKYK